METHPPTSPPTPHPPTTTSTPHPAPPAGLAAGPTFADIVQRCRTGDYDSVDALQADAAAAADLVRGLAEEAQRAEQARQAKRGRQAEQPSPEHWWVGERGQAGQSWWVLHMCLCIAIAWPTLPMLAPVRPPLAAPPFDASHRHPCCADLLAAPSRRRRHDAQAAVTAACSLQDKVDAACFLLRQELSLGEPANAQLLAAAAAHVRRLQREERERAEAERRQREADAQQVPAEELQEAAAQQGEPDQQQGQQLQEQCQQAAAQDGAAGRQQQEDSGEPDGRAVGPAVHGVSPAEEQQAGQGGGSDVQLDSAPAAATSAGVGEEQQHAGMQQQGGARAAAVGGGTAASAAQQEAEAAAAHTAEQRRQRHQLACQACLHLRQRLAAELLPAVQRRLPVKPVGEGGSVWQALQEGSGWLSAAAAAACNSVIPAAVGAEQDAQQPSELVAALLAGDAVALEHCATHLAVSCVVAFNVATKADGRGA